MDLVVVSQSPRYGAEGNELRQSEWVWFKVNETSYPLELEEHSVKNRKFQVETLTPFRPFNFMVDIDTKNCRVTP